METRTLRRDWAAVHPGPDHVLERNVNSTHNYTIMCGLYDRTYPIILRQTFPFMYKFGLNRTVPPPVVNNLTLGGA